MSRQVLVAWTFVLAAGLGMASAFAQTPPNTAQLQPAPDIPGVIKGGTMPEVVIKGLTSADNSFCCRTSASCSRSRAPTASCGSTSTTSPSLAWEFARPARNDIRLKDAG